MDELFENLSNVSGGRFPVEEIRSGHTALRKNGSSVRVRTHLATLYLAYPNATPNSSESFLIEPLTAREAEILTWTARGKTRKEISDIVCLSEETVKDYHRKISNKLNAVNKANAVSIACTLGLISPYAIEGTRCFVETYTPQRGL
ncbi:MAG: helix-turn-helix transcriptional regulator [Bdellovibrionales bacterium]